MDKITYLAELAEGLARWVPERERQDILRYYAEYFEEAGEEREAEVIQELGDPWALSCRLAVEGGFVTQEAANSWTPRKKKQKVWPFVLAGTLAAVVIVGISVATLAAKVGRFVGQAVDRSLNQVMVVDDPVYAEAWESVPNVTYVWEGGDGFWSMEDGYLEPFYAIDADISLGNITVTAGDDYTLAIQQSSNLAGYRVDWELQGDTLKIMDRSSGGSHVGLDGLGDLVGQKGLDVIITVPDGGTLSKIDVKTKFGNVLLSDLNVEVRTAAETKAGSVECYDLRTANKLELKTDAGNVNLYISEPFTGMDIDVETDMGNIEVGMDCAEWECAYELETDLGVVTVNGAVRGTKAERKDSLPYKLNAESDLGNVDVWFYDD